VAPNWVVITAHVRELGVDHRVPNSRAANGSRDGQLLRLLLLQLLLGLGVMEFRTAANTHDRERQLSAQSVQGKVSLTHIACTESTAK
jgi:hypothetical protein